MPMKKWFVGFFIGFLFITPTQARDVDGRYAQSPNKEWFDQLRSGRGLCCSLADGESVDDPDWKLEDGRYWVYYRGVWHPVPEDALVTERNRVGRAMFWPRERPDGSIFITCFMPGTLG